MRTAPRKARFLLLQLTESVPIGAWGAQPIADALAAAVVEIERAGQPALVHVTPQEVAPVAAVAKAPTALFLGDGYWVELTRELAMARSHKDRIRLALDRRNARHWEQRWYPQASAVACAAPADAAELSRLCGMPVSVLPPAVGDEWFVPPAV